MMMHLNHVINFFFYCLIGPKFRSEVKKLLPKFFFKNNNINPIKVSKSRNNTVFFPSTTYKRSPTMSNKDGSPTSKQREVIQKNLELLQRSDDFLKKFYSSSQRKPHTSIELNKQTNI